MASSTLWHHSFSTLYFQMLEFCETVKPSLQDYEADGVRIPSSFFYIPTNLRAQAWPTLLDDFVIWKKGHSGNGNAGDMDVDH
jgi:DCN1-like protein 4/5